MKVARRTLGLTLALLSGLSSQPLLAQPAPWPDKPVRLVVPFGPGGGTDILARVIAPKLTEDLGRQFIVDNKPGAGGTVGVESVVRSAPDGATFAIIPSSYVTNAALYKLPYDPVKDIAPVAQIIDFPVMLLVHPGVQANGLKEFIDLLRAKPGVLNFGSPGVGSSPHLIGELFQQMSGTKMTHVAYKSDAAVLADLVGGQIQVMFASRSATGAQSRAGKIRELAVSTGAKLPSMPEMTAIGELVPGYSVRIWTGAMAPAGTPREVIAKLSQSIGRALQAPDVLEKLRAGGIDPAFSTSEEFTRLIERDIAMWTKVVKTANITLN